MAIETNMGKRAKTKAGIVQNGKSLAIKYSGSGPICTSWPWSIPVNPTVHKATNAMINALPIIDKMIPKKI